MGCVQSQSKRCYKLEQLSAGACLCTSVGAMGIHGYLYRLNPGLLIRI